MKFKVTTTAMDNGRRITLEREADSEREARILRHNDRSYCQDLFYTDIATTIEPAGVDSIHPA